jgi:hypothetical protein
MKNVFVLAMTVVLLAVTAYFSPALGQTAGGQGTKNAGEKPAVVMVDAITATSTVTAIDKANRVITLSFEEGKVQDYKLGEEVRNFDQIEIGDEVKVTLAEAVAIFVRKAGDQPVTSEKRTLQVAPKGEKPSLVVTDTNEMAATVEKIDHAKRTVTVRRLDGSPATFKVDKNVEKLENVKVGDEVVVSITEAMAIAVEKPVK